MKKKDAEEIITDQNAGFILTTTINYVIMKYLSILDLIL